MRTAALGMVVLALVALCTSPAWAANNNTVKVKNTRGTAVVCNTSTTNQAVVLLNKTDAQLQAIAQNPTQSNLEANGGVVLAPGACFTFTNLRSGNNRIVAVFVQSDNTIDLSQAFVADLSFQVNSGQTTNLNVNPLTIVGTTDVGAEVVVVTSAVVALLRETVFASFSLGGLGLLALASLMLTRK